jgi:superfamily II DNA or RNA helicase
MALVQIAKNAVVAKLINPTREVISFVNSLLSYSVDSGGFGSWSGKSSFFDVTTNTFPAGFSYLAQEELTKIGYTVQIIANPLPAPLGEESPIVDEFGNDNPKYDYQLRALKQVEKYGAGIIRVATGGGKSKIAKLIMRRYNRMTLFLTTRGILLYQMKDQLDELKSETGVVGDGQLNFSRGVNLGMVQTLVQALEEPSLDVEVRAVVKSIHTSKAKASMAGMSRKEVVEIAQVAYDKKVKRRDTIIRFLSLIEVVIGEEAHEAGGNSYFSILKHCKNAKIRVALTATPFMRDSAEDNMRLMAAFGPVLIDIPESLLIERGILAKPYFKFVDAPAPKLLRKTSPFERAYQLGYITNEGMHDLIIQDAVRAASCGLPILSLVARTKHGDELLARYEQAGLRFQFIKGEDDMKGRRNALDNLISGKINGIIGTNILDVGVDVPAIGLVQLCGGMKAQVALRQRIGRGLRSKKTMPNFAFIAHYSCNANSYLKDHANQCEQIIRRIPGFNEGILLDGEDFNWALFGK